MPKAIRRGIFFIIAVILSLFDFVYAEGNSALDLERIVITKSKVYLLNPYSLASDDFKNLPVSSPLEALGFLPLDLQSRSPKGAVQADFSVRGSNFQGVLVLLDGRRINDPQTGHHNSDIPLTSEDIERIEVIPGLSSLLFGPDAIGGAVNFVLKKPEYKKRVLELAGGEHKTESLLFSITDKIRDLGLRFSLENQESGGFYKDTDFKKFNTTLNASLDIPDGEFTANLGYQEKEFGAYDFYTPGSGYESYEWTKTGLLSTGFNLDKGGFIIKPNFLWRRHYDKFMLDKTQIRSRYLNHHRTDLYTPSIYFQKETDSFGQLGLGLEYGGELINSTNLGKHNRSHKSIFMDDSKDLAAGLSSAMSFRIDDFEGFSRPYTGSASLKYRISCNHTLNLGVSRSIRIPSFTELYYNDPTTVGDAGLSIEKSLNYQAGCDFKKENVCLGATFFLRQEKDFIDWIKRTPVQEKWQVENISEAEVKGIEGYLKAGINKILTLDSNYTYIDKRINDQGYLYKYGPNYIKHLINTALSFNLPFGIQVVELTYKKKPVRDGWFLLNARLSYHLNKNSQIFLRTTNLLNTEYQEIEGIPQPGRWTEAGLRLDW